MKHECMSENIYRDEGEGGGVESDNGFITVWFGLMSGSQLVGQTGSLITRPAASGS